MSSYAMRSIASALAILLSVSPLAALADELPAEILKKVRSATVFVKVTIPGEEVRGSGFFVSPELVVTNAHVLGVSRERATLPNKVEVVLHSGSPAEAVVRAQVSAVDVRSDLAFLKVPRQTSVHSLTLRPSAEITETLPIYILGYPLAEVLDLNGRNPSITISSGHVSSLRRDADYQIEEIQIDGSLIPGNSGGPIIDSRGELVAVSASTMLGLNIGFSIPGDTVKADLAGCLHIASFEYLPMATEGYSVKARISTVDPLKRINRIALYYWTSPLKSKRPMDSQGKFGTHGAPGDGPRMHIELSFNARENLWVGEIPKTELRADQDFWIQPALATAAGVRRVGAISYREELRVREALQKALARARRTPQRPTPATGNAPRMGNDRPESSPGHGANSANGGSGHASARFDASRERDEAGNPYTLVTSGASRVSLGDTKLLQMVADPSGERVYAILQNQSKVFVYDPADMTVTDEILVPREPVSIWCDAERLIVACNESRVIVFIDTKTLKPVKSVRVREAEGWVPQRVVGQTSSGNAITVWTQPDGSNRAATLYFVGENGESRKVITANIEWCSFANQDLLWTQSNFLGSPSGGARVISLTGSKEADDFQREPFGRKGFNMHRSFGHCFPSADGKRFIIPTEGRGLTSGSEPGFAAYATRTLVAKPDLREIVMELDGSVFCECSAGDYYVAWKDGRTPAKTKSGPEIMYHSRSSGRTIRKIVVENFEPHPAIYTNRPAVPEVIFVPGQELVLFHDKNDQAANITVIRCGPVPPDADVPADPSMQVETENAPPKLALVGKQMAYTPSFSRPDGAKSIVFRLDQAVSGMEIDPSTGKVTFMPSDANLGLYDISIVADVDGTQIPVIRWAMEIDLP